MVWGVRAGEALLCAEPLGVMGLHLSGHQNGPNISIGKDVPLLRCFVSSGAPKAFWEGSRRRHSSQQGLSQRSAAHPGHGERCWLCCGP